MEPNPHVVGLGPLAPAADAPIVTETSSKFTNLDECLSLGRTGYPNVTARDPGRLAAGMNFARDVVDGAPADRTALIELARDGRRREWSFAEVADRSARLAGTFAAHGVERGDVVMTVIGNRPEWVLTMVACFRIGAVSLPCNEQLRAKDLAQRIAAARPMLIVADERNAGELERAAPAVQRS